MKSLILISMVGIIAVSSVFISKNYDYDENTNNIVEEKHYVEEVIAKKDKIYLAVGGNEEIKFDIVSNYTDANDINKSIESEDENICVINEEGYVYGVAKGQTNIIFKADDKFAKTQIIVTDLITAIPDEPDSEKELITGHTYSEDENDLLDEILLDRINTAGYKTRAGVVAVARFIGLEFPYRIPYFSENGRLDNYGVTFYCDGEGRYYHRGLYLNKSRYEVLDKSLYGPGVWGSYIYSIPSGGKRANGFDCSGFISWIVYNGGFEPGDVGAGLSDGIHDMTDLGEKKILKESITNNELKAGDLLSGKGSDGGHIALITGITDDKYYVAESLWVGTGYFGAIIRTYKHDDLKNYFYWHIDMDEYYGNDGNYTDYWK